MKNLKVFLKVCISTGFNKITGLLYWKTLLKVILKNPRGIETTVNLAAMYIHFYKQSEFIVQLTNKEIRNIESKMKDNYKQHISQKVSDSATSKKSLQVI
jgi:hypothetical protein